VTFALRVPPRLDTPGEPQYVARLSKPDRLRQASQRLDGKVPIVITHHRARRLVIAVLATLFVLPAVAWAGKKVVSGQQSLQIKVTVKPATAKARGATFRLQSTNLSTKPGGQQPPYNTKSIIFTEPKGASLNTSGTPSCLESAVLRAKGDASVCPATSKVGHGTVTINARPTVKSLITGTIVAYNGKDDGGFDGYAKGSPELVLWIKTSIGVNAVDYFHIVKTGGGTVKLIANAAKPAKAGIAPGNFTIQKLDLTVNGSGKKYVTNPHTCSGGWPFALTITNYFGQPSITARDVVACHS
jgi:hypothetical protein